MHLCRIKQNIFCPFGKRIVELIDRPLEIIELYALFGQIAQNGILRLLDQIKNHCNKRSSLATVKGPLHHVKRLVICGFILSNRPRERQHRRLRQRLVQAQREKISPRSPVTVIEGVNILKEKMAD